MFPLTPEQQHLQAADLILCLGYDPVEMRDAWIQPWNLETDSAEIAWAPKDHLVHRTKLEFVADLRLALAQLASLVPDRAGQTWLDGTPAAARAEIAESLRAPGGRTRSWRRAAACFRETPWPRSTPAPTGSC